MNRTTDMTQGRPLGLLLRFAVPLMLGEVCQLLYTTADSAVVGRLIGVDAFAAVGAASFLSWLAYEIILGLVQGYGVLFAQLFGRKDYNVLRKAAAMAAVLSAEICCVLTAVGIVCTEPVLRLMGTPAEILPDALIYARWVFGSAAITLANRLCSTLLLAHGNSRAPVVANLCSSVVNIVLDLLLIGLFHWGVAGAAAATAAAQLGSFGYCFMQLRRIPHLRLRRGDFAFDSALTLELLRLGGPMALRGGVCAVGGLFVQAAINRYGTLFVAGMAAAEKFFGMLSLSGSAFEGAFATYSAQNYGAGQMDRLKDGLRCSIRLCTAGAACTALLVLIFGRNLIGLLVSGEPEEMLQVVQGGYRYLVILAFTVPVMFQLCLYRSGLQGMGNSFVPTISGFVELGLRIVCVTLLSGPFGRYAIYFSSPLGWLGAMLLLRASYRQAFQKRVCAAPQNDRFIEGSE